MPTSIGWVHELVSSSRIYRLVSRPHSKSFSEPISGSSSLVPWLKAIRYFSVTDDHNSSIKQPIRASDDFFIEQSGSGVDDNGSNRSQKGYPIQQHSSEEPIPSRPLRGNKPINQPPPHFQEYNRRSNSFPPRFDESHCGPGDVNQTNKTSRTDLEFQGRNMAETNRDVSQSGDSFLDKFKLGFDNKRMNPSEVVVSGHSKEAKALSPGQPAPQSMFQDADEIFKKMKETGLIPNAAAMLDGLCKDGLVQEALKLFGLMREKGTIPEIVIYTAVVEGYTKAQKPDDAKRIFRKMQKNGISPNAFSYTVLIQGLFKCGRLEDAFEFCVEMLEAGHSPNVTTFVGLVDGFCKEKGVAEAKDAIRTLIVKGFTVNEKAVREFLDKNAPFSPAVWEAIFGKKAPRRPF